MDESLETLESLSGAGWYNDWLMGQFEEKLKGDILEVGCGIGNFSGKLTKYGQVYAIDVNKKYLERFSNKKIKSGFGDIEKANYFFKNKKFDSIICLNVLEHVKDDKKALKNMFNLLKPGGILVLLVPSGESLYGAIDKAIFHYRRYEKSGLRKLLKTEKIKILNFKRLNLIGGIGWFISGRVFKNTAVDKSKVALFNLIGPLFLFLENFYEPPVGTSLLAIVKKTGV